MGFALSKLFLLARGFESISHRARMVQVTKEVLSACTPDDVMDSTWLSEYVHSKSAESIECTHIIIEASGCQTKIPTSPHALFKEIASSYCKQNNFSLRSSRFIHDGRPIFLSSSGNMTFRELGIGPGAVIEVSSLQICSPSEEDAPAGTVADRNYSQAKSKRKVKNRKNTKRRASSNLYEVMSEEEKAKKEHSVKLEGLFAESYDRFKAIREKLDSLAMKRMQPKKESQQSKEQSATPFKRVVNPSNGGAKAGKSRFVVHVGQPENLYRTLPTCTKPPSSLSIDLHGYTKEEAISALDKSLLEWINTAMKGEHPFVVRAEIICGGGCQILSEEVSKWIKRHGQVANAPRRLR